MPWNPSIGPCEHSMLGCVFPSISVGIWKKIKEPFCELHIYIDMIFDILIKTEYVMLAEKEIRLLTKQEVKMADIEDVMLVKFLICVCRLSESTRREKNKGHSHLCIFLYHEDPSRCLLFIKTIWSTVDNFGKIQVVWSVWDFTKNDSNPWRIRNSCKGLESNESLNLIFSLFHLGKWPALWQNFCKKFQVTWNEWSHFRSVSVWVLFLTVVGISPDVYSRRDSLVRNSGSVSRGCHRSGKWSEETLFKVKKSGNFILSQGKLALWRKVRKLQLS